MLRSTTMNPKVLLNENVLYPVWLRKWRVGKFPFEIDIV